MYIKIKQLYIGSSSGDFDLYLLNDKGDTCSYHHSNPDCIDTSIIFNYEH